MKHGAYCVIHIKFMVVNVVEIMYFKMRMTLRVL